jgi:amidase
VVVSDSGVRYQVDDLRWSRCREMLSTRPEAALAAQRLDGGAWGDGLPSGAFRAGIRRALARGNPCHVTWNEVLSATAMEQAALVRSRAVASEELVRLYLERIERIDPQLNAFVSVFRRRALLDARRKDAAVRAGEVLPPFHGVPIGIKDLNVVRFSWTRMGTRAAPPIFWPFDDHTAAGLRRGGFVFVGKLSTSELGAMPVTEPDTHPPTRNPWNLWHSAGGSSGGSGAALAARLLPIAQGSDGAGSIRIPSAFCHLYGIKPSRGRVPNSFGKPDRDILYTCGPIARSVADAAAMLDVMAGLDAGKPHWAPPPPRLYRDMIAEPPRPMRIDLVTRAPFGQTDPEIAAAVERAGRLLDELGHHVSEAVLPEGSLAEFLPLWQRLVADVPFAVLSRAQPITRWLAEPGRSLRHADTVSLLRRLAERYTGDLGDADLWLTPTVAVPAPKIGAFAGRPPAEAFADAARLGAFTALFNITGQPAASIPIGLTRDGLPMGAQIAGRLHREDEVLAVSRQLEEAMPWRARQAPIGAD